MLSEFALSPAVFRQNSYESSAVADVCLGTMRGALLEDSVVRNLRAGEWAVYLSSQRDLLYPKAKELLKKLISQKRLVEHSSCGGPSPKTDESWENEAIRSHEVKPLSGLIFSRESKEERHSDKPFVACPERLVRTNFWTQRSCSCRLPRNATEYTRLLRPIFCYANFIAFIDPHIDPERPQYRDFLRLLLDPILIQRGVKPRIELHRVAWKGTGHDRRPMVQEIETNFTHSWSQTLRKNGISVEVFLWNDFHDRFLATSLMGMSWSNGFDTTNDPAARVTVSRIDRRDLDDLQKEFGGNSSIHTLEHKFTIG